MKKLILPILLLVVGFQTYAQDRNELKQLEKKYNVYAKGKVFSKASEVALLGANVRFKVASREMGETSSKADNWTKFASYAVLDGVSDATFQEIANEYEKMVVAKFKSIGISAKDYKEIQKAKSFPKLKEKQLKEKDNVRKSWGVARTFTPRNQDLIDWGYADPFGPHLKVAKELDALLFTSLVTVDFCAIGVEVSQSGFTESGSGRRHVYTEGKSTVVPMIIIDGYTYPMKGMKMGEDNTINLCVDEKGNPYHTKLDLNQSEIASKVDFATSVEKCDGCQPEFAKGRLKLMENTMGTVVIKADEQLYKKAVLDALQQYLDQVFMLYKAQQS